jgi:hypothetical protein
MKKSFLKNLGAISADGFVTNLSSIFYEGVVAELRFLHGLCGLDVQEEYFVTYRLN